MLQNEGGLSRHKNDHGGITNFGISQKFLDDHKLAIKAEDLTPEKAFQLYETYFWMVMRGDEINDQGVATAILDIGVNDGIHTSIKLAQRTAGFEYPDLIMGPETVKAINAMNVAIFLNDFSFRATNYYLQTVHHFPENKDFLTGWLARAERLKNLSGVV